MDGRARVEEDGFSNSCAIVIGGKEDLYTKQEDGGGGGGVRDEGG